MPPAHHPEKTRQFAQEVVRRLRAAGFEALWAGGCVRDQLLGHVPKDYDVATNARPDDVRNLFGHRRTLALGAAFGVITVLGGHDICPVEIATFRRDTQYSDGRHPDAVIYSTAEEDAQRRDFTINGMFYDPLTDRVIDYVGGRQDLADRLIRAIRNPDERFDEDKLRMLRAVRFATTFAYQLEAGTLSAIQRLAPEIVIVSAERIAAEMRRVLVHPHRRRGVELLRQSRLLPILIPELDALDAESAANSARSAGVRWTDLLELLESLANPTFPQAMATLIRSVHADDAEACPRICSRWRLSTDESERTAWMLQNEAFVRQAHDAPWPRLQRLLIQPAIHELVDWAEVIARRNGDSLAGIVRCREKLALAPRQLDPPPLINGNDLRRAGLRPGPQFRELLDAVRDAQLEERIATTEEALTLVRKLAQSPDQTT